MTGTLPEERPDKSPGPASSAKLRIAWINDHQTGGGAERTNCAAMEVSPFRGSIDLVTPERFSCDYEFFIINNSRLFTELQLEWIVRNRPFAVYSHDVLPTTHVPLRYEMFYLSSLNIFLSPLHLRETEIRYGIRIPRAVAIPSIFTPARLDRLATRRERPRSKSTCWVGSIYKHKGIDNVLLWARENGVAVDFYGSGDPVLTAQLGFSSYANYHGPIEDPLLLYGNHGKFIHLPGSVEACGRSVIEAYLSGCEMVVDTEKVGFFSYGLDFRDGDSVAEFLTGAGIRFWDQMARAMEHSGLHV